MMLKLSTTCRMILEEILTKHRFQFGILEKEPTLK